MRERGRRSEKSTSARRTRPSLSLSSLHLRLPLCNHLVLLARPQVQRPLIALDVEDDEALGEVAEKEREKCEGRETDGDGEAAAAAHKSQ